MNPATFPIDERPIIFIGASGSMDFTFVDENGDAMDFTGMSFYTQVRDVPGGTLLLDITTSVDDDPTSGKINISWDSSDTSELHVQSASFGMIDSNGVVWIEDKCEIRNKTASIPSS